MFFEKTIFPRTPIFKNFFNNFLYSNRSIRFYANFNYRQTNVVGDGLDAPAVIQTNSTTNAKNLTFFENFKKRQNFFVFIAFYSKKIRKLTLHLDLNVLLLTVENFIFINK